MIRSLAAGVLLLLGSICGGVAQEPGRVYRIGVISPSLGSIESVRRNTLPELARLGFVEGRNLVVEERSTEGATDRLAPTARELAGLGLDAVVAVSNPAIAAMKQAAPRLPIVMSFAGDDPVAAGFVATMARPGGTITGTSMLSVEGDAKRLQLLRDAVRGARRLGYLSPGRPVDAARHERLKSDAATLGVDLVVVAAENSDAYAAAAAALRARGVDAVAIASYPVFARDAAVIAGTLTAAGLPTICEWREMAREGCLLSYGPNNRELRRRAAHFLARILRGQPPGEIPVEEPSVFELAVNLHTARELGLTLPAEILARADDVVD
jgi:putative tryptophan/tyrosine transport system substrate-binding protein